MLLLLSCWIDPKDLYDGLDTSLPEGDADSDSDADSDADTDSDADGDPLEIFSLDPYYGSTAGGDQIILLGDGFDNNTSVYFGNRRATVLQREADALLVSSPSQSSEGWVEVRVEEGRESASLPSSFQYFEDGTGRIGVYGELRWTNYVGAGWSNPVDTGEARFYQLARPADIAFWEWYAPQMEGCQSDYSPSLVVEPYAPNQPPDVQFQGPSNIPLSWSSADGGWSADGLGAEDVLSDTDYNVVIPDLGVFPETTLVAGVHSSSAFSVSRPDFDLGSVPGVSRTNLQLAWSGGSSGAYMVAVLQLYNSGGSAVQESVSCVFADDGAFLLPSAAWSTWASNRALAIYLARIHTSFATLPYSNASSGMVGSYLVGGVALTQ